MIIFFIKRDSGKGSRCQDKNAGSDVNYELEPLSVTGYQLRVEIETQITNYGLLIVDKSSYRYSVKV